MTCLVHRKMVVQHLLMSSITIFSQKKLTGKIVLRIFLSVNFFRQSGPIFQETRFSWGSKKQIPLSNILAKVVRSFEKIQFLE